MNEIKKKIALIGNPNTGKSSIFNQLTGLKQKTGNFPGVTVDLKIGNLNSCGCLLIDFPGAYSLYPNTDDERVVLNVMSNPYDLNYPDLVVYTCDAIYLERHLLLLTQIIDLGVPVVMALTMSDLALEKGMKIDREALAKRYNIKVVDVNGRKRKGIDELNKIILEELEKNPAPSPFYSMNSVEEKIVKRISGLCDITGYTALLWGHHYERLSFIEEDIKPKIRSFYEEEGFVSIKHQVEETMSRFDKIQRSLSKIIITKRSKTKSFTDSIDRVVLNKVLGPIFFFIIMFFVFQAIFAWASYPMDLIDGWMSSLGHFVKANIGNLDIASFIADGIIAGLGGLLIFVPQIAILFFLIGLLEESGYMARVVFMFDGIMQRFGMNGKSVVGLISGTACAIPAVMSTRTISNWKERIITIFVIPFVSCSARIPVYSLLITFAVPNTSYLGINLRGIVFFSLYLLGIFFALLVGFISKKLIKTDSPSYLMMEMPGYQIPFWKNVSFNVIDKVKSFVLGAGKIILVISMILWFMASYGPKEDMRAADDYVTKMSADKNLSEEEAHNLLASAKLEASYIGHLGKFIEPVIKPLGYDWKIGIALISSFAAREVFVGTMSTLYNIGGDGDENHIIDRMRNETYFESGERVYNFASSMSLLIFYVFAMQCMATLAVVKRETRSWLWPLLQLFVMTGIAYLGAFLVYSFLS